MNDVRTDSVNNDPVPFAPASPGTSAAGVVVRPARSDDAARVARLLAQRGVCVEEALEQAPRMIDALPVLLLALLPAAVSGAAASGAAVPGDDDLGSSTAVPRATDRAGSGDALLAPAALSGAFPLPEDMRTWLPERSLTAPASAARRTWMVSGLVVDPDARRRGVGRALLTAIDDAVRVFEPDVELYSIVSTADHACVGLHLAVGFEKVARVKSFGAVTFEEQGVVLRRGG